MEKWLETDVQTRNFLLCGMGTYRFLMGEINVILMGKLDKFYFNNLMNGIFYAMLFTYYL